MDDPSGRCANCIRLKKECNFFPVDQQPSLEKRSRSDSKADATLNGASASASSSPGLQEGRTVEQGDNSHLLSLDTFASGQEATNLTSYSGPMMSQFGRGTQLRFAALASH